MLEGVAQDTSEEACALLENGASAGGPPNGNQDVSENSTAETTISPPLQARWSSSQFSVPVEQGYLIG